MFNGEPVTQKVLDKLKGKIESQIIPKSKQEFGQLLFVVWQINE